MIKILEEKVNPIINKLIKDYVKYKDNDCFSTMFILNLREKIATYIVKLLIRLM